MNYRKFIYIYIGLASFPHPPKIDKAPLFRVVGLPFILLGCLLLGACQTAPKASSDTGRNTKPKSTKYTALEQLVVLTAGILGAGDPDKVDDGTQLQPGPPAGAGQRR